MRITRDQTAISIGNVEWTDEAWEVHIRHPRITMPEMVYKAQDSGKLAFWEEWIPEDGFCHMVLKDPGNHIMVCISDGEITISGGYTKEGDDRLDGTTYPKELSLPDFLNIACVARLLLN